VRVSFWTIAGIGFVAWAIIDVVRGRSLFGDARFGTAEFREEDDGWVFWVVVVVRVLIGLRLIGMTLP
jgi:hypothetical protein